MFFFIWHATSTLFSSSTHESTTRLDSMRWQIARNKALQVIAESDWTAPGLYTDKTADQNEGDTFCCLSPFRFDWLAVEFCLRSALKSSSFLFLPDGKSSGTPRLGPPLSKHFWQASALLSPLNNRFKLGIATSRRSSVHINSWPPVWYGFNRLSPAQGTCRKHSVIEKITRNTPKSRSVSTWLGLSQALNKKVINPKQALSRFGMFFACLFFHAK